MRRAFDAPSVGLKSRPTVHTACAGEGVGRCGLQQIEYFKHRDATT